MVMVGVIVYFCKKVGKVKRKISYRGLFIDRFGSIGRDWSWSVGRGWGVCRGGSWGVCGSRNWGIRSRGKSEGNRGVEGGVVRKGGSDEE